MELYENTIEGEQRNFIDESLYENKEQLYHNEGTLFCTAESSYSNGQHMYENEQQLKRQKQNRIGKTDYVQLTQNYRVNNTVTVSEYANPQTRHTDVEARTPDAVKPVELRDRVVGRRNNCNCFLGFIIGCVLASSVLVVVNYFLLPFLRTRNNDKQTKSRCSDGWLFYQESCYYFSNNIISWKESTIMCHMMASNLVDIEDESEWIWLLKIAKQKKNNDTWIGGEGTNSTDFHWKIGEEKREMNFTNWAENQPSYPNQDCVHMWREEDYKWDNGVCHAEKQFICKQNEPKQ